MPGGTVTVTVPPSGLGVNLAPSTASLSEIGTLTAVVALAAEVRVRLTQL